MTTSYPRGQGEYPTTTLATYNRYVDNVTGANRIERWSEPPGSPSAGSSVLYWAEDFEPKIKRSIKNNPLLRWVGAFFWGRVSPRASIRIYSRSLNYPRGRRK